MKGVEEGSEGVWGGEKVAVMIYSHMNPILIMQDLPFALTS